MIQHSRPKSSLTGDIVSFFEEIKLMHFIFIISLIIVFCLFIRNIYLAFKYKDDKKLKQDYISKSIMMFLVMFAIVLLFIIFSF